MNTSLERNIFMHLQSMKAAFLPYLFNGMEWYNGNRLTLNNTLDK